MTIIRLETLNYKCTCIIHGNLPGHCQNAKEENIVNEKDAVPIQWDPERGWSPATDWQAQIELLEKQLSAAKHVAMYAQHSQNCKCNVVRNHTMPFDKECDCGLTLALEEHGRAVRGK